MAGGGGRGEAEKEEDNEAYEEKEDEEQVEPACAHTMSHADPEHISIISTCSTTSHMHGNAYRIVEESDRPTLRFRAGHFIKWMSRGSCKS